MSRAAGGRLRFQNLDFALAQAQRHLFAVRIEEVKPDVFEGLDAGQAFGREDNGPVGVWRTRTTDISAGLAPLLPNDRTAAVKKAKALFRIIRPPFPPSQRIVAAAKAARTSSSEAVVSRYVLFSATSSVLPSSGRASASVALSATSQ